MENLKQADFESLSPESITMDCDFKAQTSGDGYWSRSIKPVRVTKIVYEEEFDSVNVYFDTATWNIDLDGLIYTDTRFQTEIIAFLYRNWPGINWGSLEYTEQGLQGGNYVSMELI
jgi:hypothetical protein